MEEEILTPSITEPEEFFAELREQTTITLLSEGLLRYTDLSFASAAPTEERDVDALSVAAD